MRIIFDSNNPDMQSFLVECGNRDCGSADRAASYLWDRCSRLRPASLLHGYACALGIGGPSLYQVDANGLIERISLLIATGQ